MVVQGGGAYFHLADNTGAYYKFCAFLIMYLLYML